MAETKIKKMSIIDYYIAIPSVILSLFGIVNVYSASSNMASGSPLTYLIKQLVFVSVAMIVGFIVFHMNINNFRNMKFVNGVFLGIIFLLFVARFLTPEINGAHGWIMIAGIGIQPAEFTKVLLVIYFANYFSRRPYQHNKRWWNIFDPYKWSLPGLALIIIFFMPDTGNFAIGLFIVLVMLFASGFSYWIAALMYGLGFVSWIFSPTIIKLCHIDPSHYKTARLVAFVNPWEYIQTSGAQLINSYYAISNGGLFGVGLGNSIQKTGYLPEPNTDFIMAVVAEEWGAIVVILVLGLLGTIIGRIIQLGTRTQSQFLRVLLFGIAAYLTVQVMFNLGAVSGLLPITGVTFPFISYGGSSALVMGIMIGLALNASAVIYRERANRLDWAIAR